MATGPVAAQQAGPVVIAVLPFEDRGSYGQDKEVFRALELGIPATLAAELGRHPGCEWRIEAESAQTVQAENLGPNARVDAATAAKVGSEAGARYAVTGNFADFYGKFRLDARVVDVEKRSDPQGGVQQRAQSSGPGRPLPNHSEPGGEGCSPPVNLPAAGNAAGTRAGTVPTEALTQYSLGLLYESEGNKAKAGEHYQRALTAFPELPRGQGGDATGEVGQRDGGTAALFCPGAEPGESSSQAEVNRQRERDDLTVHLVERRKQLQQQAQQ